jgi:hypothetical protein
LSETPPLGRRILQPRLANRFAGATALQLRYTGRMVGPQKTATLNLRIDPALKDAVRVAAEQDHRSIANLIETLIRRYCKERGISIPEQQKLTLGGDDE